MKKDKAPRENEMQISIIDFLKSYNQNMPAAFPRASMAILEKFKEDNAGLFKHGDLWSLDQHRKKFMDWFWRNGGAL